MRNRIMWMLILLRDIIMMPLVMFMPRDHHKIVFGAWGGRQFGCNPKYLFEYLCCRGGFKCVWIGERHLNEQVLKVPNAHFAVKGSLKALYHCLSAKFYVYNINWRSDIIDFPRCNRFIGIYTTHGYPDKKTKDQYLGNGPVARENKSRGKVRALIHNLLVKFSEYCYSQKSWFSASSAQGEDLRVNGQPGRLSHDRVLHAGIPRADYLIRNSKNLGLKQGLRRQIALKLNIPIDKKWIVFVPTWRHSKDYLFSFAASGRREEYDKLLVGSNALILEKQHPKTLESVDFAHDSFGAIRVLDKDEAREIDTQELLMAADVLITDYSSIYYDFVLMDRPVIHFVYDYEHFMNLDMGFDFDMREYGGGPFSYTEDELLKCLAMSDAELLSRRNRATKAVQLTYETGHSCEMYYELLTRLSAGKER